MYSRLTEIGLEDQIHCHRNNDRYSNIVIACTVHECVMICVICVCVFCWRHDNFTMTFHRYEARKRTYCISSDSRNKDGVTSISSDIPANSDTVNSEDTDTHITEDDITGVCKVCI